MTRRNIGIDGPNGRLCCHCKQIKPLKDFGKDTDGPKGFHRACKKCACARNHKYYHKNKEEICARTRENHKKQRLSSDWKLKEKSQRLKKDYGISYLNYMQMHNQQNGVCAVCKRPEKLKRNGKIRALSVDHDHFFVTNVIGRWGLLATVLNCYKN